MPPEPGPARRGYVTDGNLLKQQLVPAVGGVKRAQCLLVGALGAVAVAKSVKRAAEREGRYGECRVCVQHPAEGDGSRGGLPGLERDQAVGELRLGVERIALEQRCHLAQRPGAVALARRERRGELLRVGRCRLAAERPPAGRPPGRGPRFARGAAVPDPHRAQQRVSGTKQQSPAGSQGLLEHLDGAEADRCLEVDQDVPADNEVEAGFAE
jgi:hypothetical protein